MCVFTATLYCTFLLRNSIVILRNCKCNGRAYSFEWRWNKNDYPKWDGNKNWTKASQIAIIIFTVDVNVSLYNEI